MNVEKKCANNRKHMAKCEQLHVLIRSNDEHKNKIKQQNKTQPKTSNKAKEVFFFHSFIIFSSSFYCLYKYLYLYSIMIGRQRKNAKSKRAGEYIHI